MKLFAFYKDAFREIKKSFGRFLGITLIITLGCSFFVGIKTACPDMKISANNYYVNNNLYDYKFLSTVGFKDEDVTNIKNELPVIDVVGAYFVDCLIPTTVVGRDDVIRLHSYKETDNTINKPYIIEGRMPNNSSEIAIEYNEMYAIAYELNDIITLTSGTENKLSDSIKNTKYKVVGIISSPMYIAKDRGTTSIGNGQVRAFGYILEEEFMMDYYTEIYATIDNKNISSNTPQYDELIKSQKDQFEAFIEKYETIRANNILTEANDELANKTKEYYDEKAKVRKKLDVAAKEIALNEKKLIDVAKKIANGEQKLINSSEDLIKGEKELMTGENKLASEEKKISKAFVTAQKELDNGIKDYNAGKKKYDAGLTKYNDGLSKFNKSEKLYYEKLAEYEIAKETFDSAKQIAIDNGTYEYAKDEFIKSEKLLTTAKSQLDSGKKELDTNKSLLTSNKKLLDETNVTLTNSKKEIDKNIKLLFDNKEKSQKEFAKQKILIAQSKKDLAISKTKLETAKADILKFKKELIDGQDKLADGKKEYAQNNQKAQKEFLDAEAKLEKAKEDIKDIPTVAYYFLDREKNKGYVEYGMAADRMKAIGNIFPLLFVLVAILICITSMGRMVEEQRLYIGTCKALGYSKKKIISKFILYASLSSLLGATVGCIIGFPLFPTVINNAYSILYTVPNFVIIVDPLLTLLTFVSAVLLTCLSAIFVCSSELHSVASELMRPKAPKAGKKIILEHIGFLWNKLNFTQKITMRNIIRYKSRFLMTVIGVAGCTALLLVGFGLRDVVTSIVPKQYGDISNYSLAVTLKPDIKDSEIDIIIDAAKEHDEFLNALLYLNKNVDVTKDNMSKSATLTVIDNLEEFPTHITLRERKSQKPLTMNKDGVIITEKIATMLELKVNDTISFTNSDLIKKEAKILGITENYLMHHIYMSKSLYEDLYKVKPAYNDLFIKLKTTTLATQEELSKELTKIKMVSSVAMTSELSVNFFDTIGSINAIIVILVISAALLSFIVLFTLASINISERLREIATIKVLGMFDSEVSSYVFRESLFVTIIGIIVGLIIGGPLALFVILSAEIDMVMFGRDIYFLSYLIAGSMTLFFAFVVNYIMGRKLKKINMVEALKTVE